MNKFNNKKTIKKTIIILAITSLVLLIFGLIFIGVGKLGYEGVESNGFDLIKETSVSDVLSGTLLKLAAEALNQTNQLQLIRCGIVFAIIFTPMLFGFAAILSGYYYSKFIKQENKTEIKETKKSTINE